MARTKTPDQLVTEVLAATKPLPPLNFPTPNAYGCVLAQNVVAPAPVPERDLADIDGYAIRAADVAQATADRSVKLSVIGEVTARSSGLESIRDGQCARIGAGGPLPNGANAVVAVEETDGGQATVQVRVTVTEGGGVRRAGSECQEGQHLMKTGEVLTVPRIGLAAALGMARLVVHPVPRVSVISVETGQGSGDSTGASAFSLSAAVREAGASPHRAAIDSDHPHEVSTLVEDHLIRSDAVIVACDSGRRARDIVRGAVSDLGDVSFHDVSLTPSGPIGFGFIGPEEVPAFCLAGDPVQVAIGFEFFVRPALRRLGAAARIRRPRVSAVCSASVTTDTDAVGLVPCQVGWNGSDWVANPLSGSTVRLTQLAAANGLLDVPIGTTGVSAGQRVSVMLTDESMAAAPLTPAQPDGVNAS